MLFIPGKGPIQKATETCRTAKTPRQSSGNSLQFAFIRVLPRRSFTKAGDSREDTRDTTESNAEDTEIIGRRNSKK
ncbi:MAG: hypothetical protein DMF26_01540 [Verrucomicrobia bacterium]|nr:MAG: hypothetical protein DMF26_01540 [Verrucomicrobiota bacterium]